MTALISAHINLNEREYNCNSIELSASKILSKTVHTCFHAKISLIIAQALFSEIILVYFLLLIKPLTNFTFSSAEIFGASQSRFEIIFNSRRIYLF